MNLRPMLSFLLLAACGAGAPAVAADKPLSGEWLLPRADLSPASLQAMAQSQQSTPTAYHRVAPLRIVTPAMKSAPSTSSFLATAPRTSVMSAPAPATNVTTAGTSLNFDGIASDGTGAPADPEGAVGDTQYVQWVNTSLSIYRKSDGALLLGPIPGNVLFAGMTGSPGATACATSNWGDPIVQYDKAAKRWIMTQFAWDPAKTATGPYYQCIAVSTSADATGSYYRYAWEIHNSAGAIVFNDYPKMAVWPDAYYFTWVLFESATGGAYLGPRACGLERAPVLAGGAPRARCYDFGPSYGPVLPSDLDGTTAPPAGSPNYMMSLDFADDGKGDHLFLWRFSFTDASVTDAITIPVSPFTIGCPSQYGGPCVRQPSPGEKLDALADRLMYRLAYRNFGNREALVVNHTVQQPGAAADGPVGVRWYEIRNPGGAASVYQQGTWAPDSLDRWMGSIAMDRMGNISLGYSVSGTSTAPGVRYTGRLRSEPLGRMEPEAVIVNGGGVQVDTYNRWGDYSAMTVDPANDCAFWYTQQYIKQTGSFNWATRIAAFRFKNCSE